ncbi:MAG: ABC transporter ATP-binding protein [Candidatus Sumerlaeota bacterium]|nr:ABC transporter ATP-binding protein [Candidatus Sumerlaeota bacterium]
MSETAVISTRNLMKRFGSVQALHDLTLDIFPGRIVGLMGANGCGKSTLMRHIIGLYLPDEGRCTTFGVEAARLGPKEMARIGYVHQEGELLDWMSTAQLIRYVAAYYPNWNADLEKRYAAEFELNPKSRVGALSPGQRQKLAILLAIGFEPELLILDEPAAAMDPLARRQFLDLILEMIQAPNRTILISSHILTDIEKVIDHALIMDKGRLLRDCSFDDLREEFLKIRITALQGDLPAQLPFANVIEQTRNGSQALLTLSGRAQTQEQIEALADSIHCQIERLPLPLEDIYRLVVEEKRGKGGAR